MDLSWIPKEARDVILFVLTLVAGSGGVMYWVDRWRDRVRLSARILKIDDTFFEFEVENYGKNPCSLAHRLSATGYQKVDGRFVRITHSFSLNTPDRALPPKSPRRFSAFKDKNDCDIAADEVHFVLVLPRYRIAPTRGRSATPRGLLHSRRFSLEHHGDLPALGITDYWRLVTRLRFSGRLPTEVEPCVGKLKGSLTTRSSGRAEARR